MAEQSQDGSFLIELTIVMIPCLWSGIGLDLGAEFDRDFRQAVRIARNLFGLAL